MPQEARSIEQRQIVVEEPNITCNEMRMETDEQRSVSYKRGPEPLIGNTVDDLSRERDRSAALKPNREKILSYMKLMKNVSTLTHAESLGKVLKHKVIRNPDSILGVPPTVLLRNN